MLRLYGLILQVAVNTSFQCPAHLHQMSLSGVGYFLGYLNIILVCGLYTFLLVPDFKPVG